MVSHKHSQAQLFRRVIPDNCEDAAATNKIRDNDNDGNNKLSHLTKLSLLHYINKQFGK